MNIASIQWPVFNPYGKATVEIYISGCNNNCADCHGAELKDFDYGKELDFDELFNELDKREGFYNIISVLGGDLLCQDDFTSMIFSEILCLYARRKKLKLWLFTGKDEIPDWCKIYYDVIKYGAYMKELSQKGFPSSSNQQIWRKQESV